MKFLSMMKARFNKNLYICEVLPKERIAQCSRSNKKDMRIDDYAEIWEAKDAITTVVEANGYTVYDLRHTDHGFRLELNRHIDDEAASYLCSQFPLPADYFGEGHNGTVICLYR